MESKAFRICPFCQAQNPASVSRCVRCARSLAGLPLPVYGEGLDAEMRPGATADLVDLPLRHGDAGSQAPPPAVHVTPPPTTRSSGRPRQRSRDKQAARLAIAAGLMGAAGLLGVVLVVGGWLVRAQDREEPEAAAIVPTTVPTVTVPPATPLPAAAPATTVTAAPALTKAKPAAPRTAAAPDRSPAEPPPPPVAYATPPMRPRPPAAEVIRVHPDVAAAPVDVERARDDYENETPEPPDAGARAALRARLDRAQQRREAAAERVRELRAQVNVPVIKDVGEYQRRQEELSAALDELDQAEVEVRRFRRALRRRGE